MEKQTQEIKFENAKFELIKQDDAKGVNKYRYTDGDIFKAALKDAGIKADDYKLVKNFEKAYAEAATTAIADFAKATLKSKKELKGVIVDTPFGRNGKIQAAVTREVTGKNSLTGKDYRVTGLSIKIKDSTIPKSHVASLKEDLTAALLGAKK